VNATLAAATLSPEEIFGLTGYKRPADQLRELHDQGFYRARLAKTTGDVILERPHYDAVSAGLQPGAQAAHRPQVRSTLRRVK
jgi:hypothetical protein